MEKPEVLKDYLKLLIYIGVVCFIGFLAANQTMSFFYKIEFLKQPCKLCGELNPGVLECILQMNAPANSFWIGGDNWSEPIRSVGYYYALEDAKVYTKEIGEEEFKETNKTISDFNLN